jgi:hypothetical protein
MGWDPEAVYMSERQYASQAAERNCDNQRMHTLLSTHLQERQMWCCIPRLFPGNPRAVNVHADTADM